MSEVSAKSDRWPFFRHAPDCVVLGVRPGYEPSSKPPVRIFLGTEEAQYRGERIFFYSIEKVRDPSRVYEIHLMKNLEGFDRRKWRTGFTNYRYAIPELAGGTGRAIYNDVDQIYLADPALLFDLPMGDHGYLAISAKDTSVMLINCPKMMPIWNRATASSMGKHELINKPASTPGLWGHLDGHWNARDQEYVEGLTKCLHYTALHQQPWHPFPDDYSYHPNPLAYIWYDLEREADAQGYELFGIDRPSPNFAAVLGRNNVDSDVPVPLDDGIGAMLERAGTRSVLLVQARGAVSDWNGLPQRAGAASFTLSPNSRWPDAKADAVLAAGLLERIPPADIPWVLDGLFAHANKLVEVRVPATEPVGLGSAEWWRKRLDEAARKHPHVSWQLDICDRAALIPDTRVSYRIERPAAGGAPRVWALVDGDANGDAQVQKLADALGWGFETKRLFYNLRSKLPNAWHGASLASVDRDRSSRLDEPLPDLVIAAGKHSAPVAGWIRKASEGRTRVVQLGHPKASFDLFDLIVTAPDHRLPVRDNVLHVTAPLAGIDADRLEESAVRWRDRIGDGEAPRTVLLVGPGRGSYRMTASVAGQLGQLAGRKIGDVGGSLWVALAPGLGDEVITALTSSVGRPFETIELTSGDMESVDGLLVAADRCMLTGDDARLLATACLAGKPVDLFELPRWYDTVPGGRPLVQVLTLIAGGGNSYRGTPHQQHLVARGLDHLTTRGLIRLPRDLARLHRALVARGLVNRLDDDRAVASRKPLNDLELTIERIRRLMNEVPRIVGG
ncbi:MAG: mitochondrial fission ELM1 family protein [Geminicoccaceae bacterium]|nr:mitochondrial fission ELM1 family protein [Geminicoccaceae bacterium]